MSCLPHDRRAAPPPDIIIEALGTLDLGYEGSSWTPGQDLAGKDNEKAVAEDHPTLLVDDADAVTVAVVGDSDIEPLAPDKGGEIAEIFQHRGVRLMVRKGPVRFAVEVMDLASQAAEERESHRPAHGVSGVQADPETPFQANGVEDVLPVGADHVGELEMSSAGGELAPFHEATEILDLGAEDGVGAVADLEAVVF